MLDIKDVDICVSTRYLVKNLNLTLNRGDKCAIIGEEGNGKSTILKAILGICDYGELSGCINFKGNRVGYLKQNLRDEVDSSVRNFLFVDDEDYYDKIAKFYSLLDEVNLSDEILNQRIQTLSGGEMVKISIVKILLDDPEILFLDEPTNDLDIASLEWLENFINNTDKPILYVSHDETLLSNTANMILHIEQVKKKTECKHTLARCSYDEYVDARLRNIEKETRIAKNERREEKKKEEKLNRLMQSVQYKQNNISRADPHGAKVLKIKMRALKAQEARLEKTELLDVPDPEESINFSFEDVFIPKEKVVLKLSVPKLFIGEKLLVTNLALDVKGPEHVCIIGANGVGKTTLIKLIYDILKDRNDIVLGYMPQDYKSVLDGYKCPLDFIAGTSIEDVTEARKYLGNMKFTRDEMTGSIDELSNGSIAKLFITKLVRDKCNVLLLDEPTRNTSPLSNPVIREKLKNFKGTIISVSHDRKYIDEVATVVYEMTLAGLRKVK